MSNYSHPKNLQNENDINQLDKQAEPENSENTRSSMGPFMLLCCLAMFAAFAVFVLMAPAGQSWTEIALGAAPLLACFGVHLIMHRFMGKSCHGEKEK